MKNPWITFLYDPTLANDDPIFQIIYYFPLQFWRKKLITLIGR